MPGHDKSRFLTNKIEDLDEFICGICQAVFVNPVVTRCCQQTYCSDCINQWLNHSNTCPNDRRTLRKNGLFPPPRAFMNLLENLVIYCENRGEGCVARVKMSELDKHSNECEYKPNSLCKVCQTKRECFSTHNCVESLLKEREMFEKEKIKFNEKLNNLAQQNSKDVDNFRAKLKEFKKLSLANIKMLEDEIELLHQRIHIQKKILISK